MWFSACLAVALVDGAVVSRYSAVVAVLCFGVVQLVAVLQACSCLA
jgi:hypothetical protein